MRVHAGWGGVRSEVLGGYVVVTDDGRFRLSNDAGGEQLWPTAEEAARRAEQEARTAERIARQAAQAAREAEQAAHDAEQAALRRVAELEAELRKRSRPR